MPSAASKTVVFPVHFVEMASREIMPHSDLQQACNYASGTGIEDVPVASVGLK